MKWMILAVLISLLTSICLAAEKGDAPAQSTDELRQQLEKYSRTRIPMESRWRLFIKTGPNG